MARDVTLGNAATTVSSGTTRPAHLACGLESRRLAADLRRRPQQDAVIRRWVRCRGTGERRDFESATSPSSGPTEARSAGSDACPGCASKVTAALLHADPTA